jgi:hypothetical protein
MGAVCRDSAVGEVVDEMGEVDGVARRSRGRFLGRYWGGGHGAGLRWVESDGGGHGGGQGGVGGHGETCVNVLIRSLSAV